MCDIGMMPLSESEVLLIGGFSKNGNENKVYSFENEELRLIGEMESPDFISSSNPIKNGEEVSLIGYMATHVWSDGKIKSRE